MKRLIFLLVWACHFAGDDLTLARPCPVAMVLEEIEDDLSDLPPPDRLV